MVEKLRISRYGQGEPLVFVHGWGLNSGVWQPLVQQLSSEFEVITVDLPGFGINAERVPKAYELTAVVDMLSQCIEKPAVYIGWSLGGLIASKLAIDYPEQVRALVTVASSPCFVERDTWPGMKAMVLQAFHQQLLKDSQQTIENFLKIQAMGSPHLRHDIRLLHDLIMQYPQPNRTVLEASLDLLEQGDIRDELANLKQPVLRLYGRLDSLVPIAVAELLQPLLPQSEQYIFAKASHAPFISHPEEFYRVLHHWLLRHRCND